MHGRNNLRAVHASPCLALTRLAKLPQASPGGLARRPRLPAAAAASAPSAGRAPPAASSGAPAAPATGLAPATPAAPALPRVNVEFVVQHWELDFGDGVRLVGSAPELGNWDPDHGLVLEWREGHNWAALAQLPPGEFKFKASAP